MAIDNHTDLHKVTPLADWFDRVGLPYRSGIRLMASGKGPVTVQLTARRRGVSERDHIAWVNAKRDTANTSST